MLAVGLGELGLLPKDFYSLTMDEFMIMIQGKREKEIENWWHTRAICFMIVKPHLKNKHMKIERFWPLPGDEVKGGISAMKSREDKMKAFKELKQWYIDNGHLSNN